MAGGSDNTDQVAYIRCPAATARLRTVMATASELSLEDSSFPALADVLPTWRQHKPPTVPKAVYTDPQQHHDAEMQTTDRCDAAIQTATGILGLTARPKATADSLAAFLLHVEPTMTAELQANESMSARTARASSKQHSRQEAAECIFELTAFSDGSSSAANARVNKHQLQVTAVSWSKTGQTLAAAYGRYDVEGWRTVPGALATWNLARLGINTQGSPDRLIDVDNCLMCCAFHPVEPALLAGGTYHGEVVIWDLTRDDVNAQVAKTDVLSEARHREPITSISWQYSSQEARRHGAAAASYRLFTLGADGRLLVWLWTQALTLLYGYELSWTSPSQGASLSLGGSCMAFCPSSSAHQEASTVLVGTEGGRLLRCQVNDINEVTLKDFAIRQAPGSTSKLELRSAVKDAAYEQLAATVNALSACPHHPQLAAAAGGDGTLRLVDVLRATPLLVLEPSAQGLLTAAWSPSRPMVIAAGARDGQVYIYDLAAKQRIVQPVAQLCVDASNAHRPQQQQQQQQQRGNSSSRSGSGTTSIRGVNVLEYNHAVPSVLAAAAGDQIKVFRLPSWLVDVRPGEEKLLKRLVESEDVLGLLKRQALVV